MVLRSGLTFLLLITPLWAKSVNSRNVHRSGDSGDVNLVEFNIRGTVYGKCTFDDENGQHVSFLYEEKGSDLVSRSANPTIVDPISGAKKCRAAATKPPSSPEGRSGYVPESAQELKSRFDSFMRKSVSNQRYVQQLEPRFFSNFIGGPSLSTGLIAQSLGLSFGGNDEDRVEQFGTVNYLQNQNEQPLTSVIVDSSGDSSALGNLFPFLRVPQFSTSGIAQNIGLSLGGSSNNNNFDSLPTFNLLQNQGNQRITSLNLDSSNNNGGLFGNLFPFGFLFKGRR